MTIQQKCAERIYEILPHKKHEEHFLPIRLADVLMAIEKQNPGTLFYKNKFERSNLEEIYLQYHLSKDNILDQSDQFCAILLDLIK
jgi:hypothetical protein